MSERAPSRRQATLATQDHRCDQVSSLRLCRGANHSALLPNQPALDSRRQQSTASSKEMDAIFKDHLKKRRRKASLALPTKSLPVFSLSFLVFIIIITTTSQSPESAHATQDVSPEAASSSSFFDEPQPFVYMALNFESGSGDGGYPARARAQASPDLNQLNLADQSSSVSPSLIAAKCWNNNQFDSNECRQFNVITSANAPMAIQPEEDDSLITPVLLFESSPAQDVPPTSAADKHLSPPYYTSTWSPDSSNVIYNNRPHPSDGFAGLPITQPLPEISAVTLQPTSRIHIATRRPMLVGSTSTSRMSTTQGRKCRDENDEDCDEPEEPRPAVSGAKPGSTAEDDSAEDEEDDIEDDSSDPTPSAAKPNLAQESSKAAEMGSGVGPADDSDGGDDIDDNPEGSSGVSEEQNELTTHQAEISSEVAEFQPALPGLAFRPTPFTSSIWTSGAPTTTTSTSPTLSQPRTTARIEVIVHSTLPPSFPTTSSTSQAASSDAESLPRPNDSLDSSDTFTSLPVFPPSSASSNSTNRDVDPASSPADLDARTSLSELDLATFKPIPFSLADNQKRLLATMSNESNTRVQSTDSPDTFKFSSATSRFENPWQHSPSTRAPMMRASAPSELPMRGSSIQDGGPSRVGTEMLPQMILYSSIVILIVTAIIFVLMALTLWRRNNARQQALLQKSQQLLNGRTSQMVASLSHASQLMHQPPGQPPLGPAHARQPGLLSTYAPGKGMTLAKVTTSLIKNSDDNLIMNDEVDVDEEEQLMNVSTTGDNRSKGHQMGGSRLQTSWSNSATTTSNSHSGSQRTDTSQHENSNGEQGADGQRTYHHSNSLSDGRQNSSSISDSQESAQEPALSQTQPFVNQPGNPTVTPLQPQMAPYAQGRQPGTYRPPLHPEYYNDPPWPNQYRPVPMAPTPVQFYPRAPGSLAPSRSVEDMQRGTHLDLVPDWQAHKGTGLPHQPPQKPPHMGRLTPSLQQQVGYPYHDSNMYPYGPPPHANIVASNPLATMARGGYSGHYMNQQQPNGTQGSNYNGVPPPVVGRKDRSEAWYV